MVLTNSMEVRKKGWQKLLLAICQNDSLDEECTLPRIIGIEGIWGSGKSNVVKMLERELSDDYYFLSMTHGDIKRTCNAALYWNCLQANLLMMVSYLEMQQ